MYQYAFNPFGKDLDLVSETDLLALTTVAEGWYLDYKEQPISVADLAKHLCAFANQFGGWLIFGVAEAIDGSQTAGSFTGLSEDDLAVLTLRVREAATAHASPSILYEEKRVPVAGGTRSTLIIGIPMGASTPYIHSSGRVYRRLGDQSKPESDRHALDQLWERGKQTQHLLASRLRQIPEYPDSQRDTSWVHVHFVPDLRMPDQRSELSMSAFRAIASGHSTPNFGLAAPMTSVQSAMGGYVARQTRKETASLGSLTLRWWRDGVCRVDIPINRYSVSSRMPPVYRHFSAFARAAIEQGYEDSGICDFTYFLQSLAALMNAYTYIRSETNDSRPLYATFRLRNFSHVVPFYDSSAYLKQCSDTALPFMLEGDIEFPADPDFQSMIPLRQRGLTNFPDALSESDLRNANAILAIAPLVGNIFNSAGMLWDVDEFIADRDLYRLDSLHSGPRP
jgi:hypothetical protein